MNNTVNVPNVPDLLTLKLFIFNVVHFTSMKKHSLSIRELEKHVFTTYYVSGDAVLNRLGRPHKACILVGGQRKQSTHSVTTNRII